MDRRGVTLIATAAMAMMLAACVAVPSGDGTATTASESVAAESGDDLVYVAIGDSWPYGGHCGGCETFIDLYADALEGEIGRDIDYQDLSLNGGGTIELRERVETDQSIRDALAAADVIVIATGLNDLDTSGALQAMGEGACGVDDACLTEVYDTWRKNYDVILREIATLRAGAPTALRLVTAQNIFVSDPTLAPYFALPADFGVTTGVTITQQFTTAVCDAAAAYEGACIDVMALFNGPDGVQPRDENTAASHQEVADALLASGTAELTR